MWVVGRAQLLSKQQWQQPVELSQHKPTVPASKAGVGCKMHRCHSLVLVAPGFVLSAQPALSTAGRQIRKTHLERNLGKDGLGLGDRTDHSRRHQNGHYKYYRGKRPLRLNQTCRAFEPLSQNHRMATWFGLEGTVVIM